MIVLGSSVTCFHHALLRCTPSTMIILSLFVYASAVSSSRGWLSHSPMYSSPQRPSSSSLSLRSCRVLPLLCMHPLSARCLAASAGIAVPCVSSSLGMLRRALAMEQAAVADAMVMLLSAAHLAAAFGNVVKLVVCIVGQLLPQHLRDEEKGRGGLYTKPPVMPLTVYPIAELEHSLLF